MRNVVAIEKYLAVGRLVKAHKRAPDGRFAAARLADQTHCLALTYLERYAVDRLYKQILVSAAGLFYRKVCFKVFYLEYVFAIVAHAFAPCSAFLSADSQQRE